MVYPTKNISVSIDAATGNVYNFVANPANLPKWASGLSQSEIRKQGQYWVADSPIGEVKIKFAENNTFGILDHSVTLPNGEVNYNPLRVVKNGKGSEVIFTLFRLPRMTDEDFNKDAEFIKSDLEKLKSILEKSVT